MCEIHFVDADTWSNALVYGLQRVGILNIIHGSIPVKNYSLLWQLSRACTTNVSRITGYVVETCSAEFTSHGRDPHKCRYLFVPPRSQVLVNKDDFIPKHSDRSSSCSYITSVGYMYI